MRAVETEKDGEERQRLIEGEGSSTAGHSQGDDWGDEEEVGHHLETASLAGSATEKPMRGYRQDQSVERGDAARHDDVLASMKRKSYTEMCARVEVAGVVHLIDQRVAGLSAKRVDGVPVDGPQ